MSEPREIELVFEPLEGEDTDDASRIAGEALALCVEGVREDGGSLDTGVIRRRFAPPA